ncbi:MAG: hypothetical protein ACD_46C00522G0006 [uncultured bacterium]|nr:MAG: hypothetical protein ACD_46C00522G0006 [uncultured bacterium]
MNTRDLSSLPTDKLRESAKIDESAKIELVKRAKIIHGNGEVSDEEAIKIAKVEVEGKEPHPVYAWILGFYYDNQNDEKLAEKYLYQAAKSQSNNQEAHLAIAGASSLLGKIKKENNFIIEYHAWWAHSFVYKNNKIDTLFDKIFETYEDGKEGDSSITEKILPAKYIHHSTKKKSTWSLYDAMLIHLFLCQVDISLLKKTKSYGEWNDSVQATYNQLIDEKERTNALLNSSSKILMLVYWSIKHDEYNYFDYFNYCRKYGLLPENICMVLMEKFLEHAKDPLLRANAQYLLFVYYQKIDAKKAWEYFDVIPIKFFAEKGAEFNNLNGTPEKIKYEIFEKLYVKDFYPEALKILKMIQDMGVLNLNVSEFFTTYPQKLVDLEVILFKYDLYQKISASDRADGKLLFAVHEELKAHHQLKETVDQGLKELDRYIEQRKETRQQSVAGRVRYAIGDFFNDETNKRSTFVAETKNYVNKDSVDNLTEHPENVEMGRLTRLNEKIAEGKKKFPPGLISRQMLDTFTTVEVALKSTKDRAEKYADPNKSLIDLTELKDLTLPVTTDESIKLEPLKQVEQPEEEQNYIYYPILNGMNLYSSTFAISTSLINKNETVETLKTKEAIEENIQPSAPPSSQPPSEASTPVVSKKETIKKEEKDVAQMSYAESIRFLNTLTVPTEELPKVERKQMKLTLA